MLQNDPELVLYGTEEVYVRDGMVCSRIRPEVFASLRFMTDGAPVPVETANELRAMLASAFSGIDETCSRLEIRGDVMESTVCADGVEQPDLADTMIWIRREDGFALSAPDADGT